MIIAMNGTVRIEGQGGEILAEATAILHSVYESLVEHGGEEFAREQLADMGRLVVMSKEELAEEVKSKIEGLIDHLN